MTGIEPALSAWEADVLPLNYIRMTRQGLPKGILRLPCQHIVPERATAWGYSPIVAAPAQASGLNAPGVERAARRPTPGYGRCVSRASRRYPRARRSRRNAKS
jgi:hypothetical protein